MEGKTKTRTIQTTIEMSNVPLPSSSTSATPKNDNGNLIKATTNTCTPQVCRSARQRYQPPDLASNSPWNRKKTYFFIGIIGLLILWIIIYSVVSVLKLV